MLNRTPIKIFIGIMIAIFLVAYVWHQRGAQNFKGTSLLPHEEILIRTSKLKPHFNVKLKNSAEPTSPDTNSFSLTAIIQTEKNISQLNYRWILPNGVSLPPSTPAEGTISNIAARGGHTWTTPFNNSSEKNGKIHLRIWINDSAGNLVSSAQYNTHIQNEIDVEKSELVKRQNEYLLDHPELLKKFK